jgi:hypothetical protein
MNNVLDLLVGFWIAVFAVLSAYRSYQAYQAHKSAWKIAGYIGCAALFALGAAHQFLSKGPAAVQFIASHL